VDVSLAGSPSGAQMALPGLGVGITPACSCAEPSRPTCSRRPCRRWLQANHGWRARGPANLTLVSRKRLEHLVAASGTTTIGVFGVGPVVAATVVGVTGDIARFPTATASLRSTAPQPSRSPPEAANSGGSGEPHAQPYNPHGRRHPAPGPAQPRAWLRLSQLRNDIHYLWQTSDLGESLMVWAGEQRAIGLSNDRRPLEGTRLHGRRSLRQRARKRRHSYAGGHAGRHRAACHGSSAWSQTPGGNPRRSHPALGAARPGLQILPGRGSRSGSRSSDPR